MIEFTDGAKEKLAELFSSEEYQDMALRIQIMGRGPGGFRYSMRFMPASEATQDDERLALDDLTILVDASPEVAFRRVQERQGELTGRLDPHEDLGRLRAIRAVYLEMITRLPHLIVDGNRGKAEILEEAREGLSDRGVFL